MSKNIDDMLGFSADYFNRKEQGMSRLRHVYEYLSRRSVGHGTLRGRNRPALSGYVQMHPLYTLYGGV